MIMYLYATKNKKSGNFGKVSTEVYEPEKAVVIYSTSAKEAHEKEKVYLAELDLYTLGTIDTQTGVITSKVEFLFDIGTVYVGNEEKVS